MNPQNLSKLSILYVEDEIDLRDTTSDSLQSFVKEIRVAADGKEGLAVFKNGSFDLVITDINMPKMNGNEMMAEIKKIDPDIPIIVTTAHNDEKEIDRMKEAGMSSYIMKPIDLTELVKEILVLFP